MRYYLRSLAAHVRGGPVLYLLTVVGVALGVASVLSIQIINRNAIAAFAAGVQAVSGEADLSVLGRTPTFPERLYADVLAEPGVAAAWPLYRIDVALADRAAFFLEVVGIDLFTPVRVPWRGEPQELADALRRPGWVAITPGLAATMGWHLGDAFEVTSGSRRVRLVVGALVDWKRRSPRAGSRLALMDIAQAQGLLGRPGGLSQIDVQVAAGTDAAELAARLRTRLGPAVQVLTPAEREERAADLLGAFRLNLTALSLISLLVGLFLVHESAQAALVRRRSEFGLLRSLGATRGQVLGLILGEVVLLGVLGVALGLPLGYWVAAANVEVVSATLTNLYLLEEIESLHLPWWIAALAAVMGIGGAVAGGLWPALDMGRKQTTALLAAFTLHEEVRSIARPLVLAGLALLGAAGAWFWWAGWRWQPAGFVLGIALLVAIPLITPFLVERSCGWVRVRGFGFGYSLKSLATRLQTTSFAVASLAIAVSMLVGITLMIGSFRRTVEVWVNTTVRADVYVSTPSWARGGPEATLDAGLVTALGAHPRVAFVDRLRKFSAYTGDRRISVAGVDMALPGREERFAWLAGHPAQALRRVREEGAVLISEPLARKAGLGVGDRVAIAGADGERAFPIAGVYYDYSTEGGAVVMDLATLNARFGPGGIQSLALYLRPGWDSERVIDELRGQFARMPLVFRSNRRLRQEVFAIFDQTFAVTRILQAMSLLIAVSGITLTLLVLARERLSELALYRSLGACRRQLFGLFVGKGLGMAVLALALGLLGGIALAAILILVINRAYFGWTIQLHWPWGAVLQQIATIMAAAVLASLYPALRASQAPATELSRDDL
ncbi:MAG: ABC transporter permease [Candidatus Rokubacteria bacterium]|nr:ABC transporter permease [Candidatus Rokubacteria bacterium]